MNRNIFMTWQSGVSGWSRWLIVLAVICLMGSVGFRWLIDSFLILVGFLIVTPVIVYGVLRWWVQRNLVQDACPVCGFGLTGFNGTELNCPSCGEPVKVANNQFMRFTPPGTVDVRAVEVEVADVEMMD